MEENRCGSLLAFDYRQLTHTPETFVTSPTRVSVKFEPVSAAHSENGRARVLLKLGDPRLILSDVLIINLISWHRTIPSLCTNHRPSSLPDWGTSGPLPYSQPIQIDHSILAPLEGQDQTLDQPQVGHRQCAQSSKRRSAAAPTQNFPSPTSLASTFLPSTVMASDEKRAPSSDEKGVTTDLLPYAEILERQTSVPDSKVGYFGLYRYATPKELLVLGLSTVFAVAAGAIIPTFPVSLNAVRPNKSLTFLASVWRYGRPVSCHRPRRDPPQRVRR